MREDVDLPTVHALQREWRRHPPVHHLVAAYIQYKAPLEAPEPGTVREPPDVGALVGLVGEIPISPRAYQPIDSTAFDAAMAAKAAREQQQQ